MKRASFALGWALCLALLPRCDQPASAPTDVAALPDALADAYCDGLGRCGLLGFQSIDRAECLAMMRASMLQTFNGGLQAVARQTARYDRAAAQHVMEVLRGFSCRRGESTGAAFALALSRLFVGQLTTDAACGFNEECAQGECSPRSNCNLSCCMGRCRPLFGAGAPCSFGRCQVGLDCVAGKCAERPTVGASCAETFACQGAICDPASRTCVALVATGGACAGSAICDNFLDACIDGTCRQRLALDLPCKRNDECRSNRCRETCQPSLGEGAACMLGSDCKSGRCRSASGGEGPGTCQLPPLPAPPSCPG